MHTLARFSGPGMHSLIVGEFGDARTNFVRPRGDAANTRIEVQVHPLTGCREKPIVGMVHTLELVNALIVERENLRRHNVFFTFDDFALPTAIVELLCVLT